MFCNIIVFNSDTPLASNCIKMKVRPATFFVFLEYTNTGSSGQWILLKASTTRICYEEDLCLTIIHCTTYLDELGLKSYYSASIKVGFSEKTVYFTDS